MDRRKISGIISILDLIIFMAALYLGSTIGTNAPELFLNGAALGIIVIILILIGSIKSFLGNGPATTQLYFIGGIFFSIIIVLMHSFSFDEIYTSSVDLFTIFYVLVFLNIGILIVATCLMRIGKGE